MALADSKKRFAESVVWVEKMLPQIDFDAEEVTYKLEYAKGMREVRRLWRDDNSNWSREFIDALKPSNLLNWRYENELVRLAETEPERLNVLLSFLWKKEPTASQFNTCVSRLREFSETFTPGVATAVASTLLMVYEDDNYPPFRPVAVHRFWKTMQWPPPKKQTPTAYELYNHFLRSLREFQRIAMASSLEVDSLIRVQGYMWLITEWDPRTALPSSDVAAFKGWRGDTSGAVTEGDDAAALRTAVMAELQGSHQQLYSEEELLEFEAESKRVPLIDRQAEAVIPRGSLAPLTLRVSGPLIDPSEADGRTHIRFPRRSHNLKHFQDQAMLQAIELNVPIILLTDHGNGEYQAIYPVRVRRYVHKHREFELELSGVYLPLDIEQAAPEYVRRWIAASVWRRIHQPMFRRDVMEAYADRCAVCGLNIPELLDAAHIVPDREQGGIASASNGLALCKLHHEAFDANLLGIDVDYVVHVAPQIMSGSYSASVDSNIRNYDGCRLAIIPSAGWRPKPELLKNAWTRFQRGQGHAIHAQSEA